MVLERYESLVADFAAFQAVCERPLPRVVRVNTIKTTTDRAVRALSEAGYDPEPTAWYPELLRLQTETPGTTWPYFHGWLYGQEEVSALPALVLDPQPGEQVLDACAAPGSKTTQIAALMDDSGCCVANDANLGRISALRSNAERCGVTNLLVTNGDARHISLDPVDGELFDRALVDVPCSCEGTIRKNPDAIDDWSMGHVNSIASVQLEILQRAVQVTRPGGTVVYSTCTFAPEENEAILDQVLEAAPCRIVESDLPIESRPGVTEWNGEQFDPSVKHAHRIYPHLNDTGGFFCAKLEVTAEI